MALTDRTTEYPGRIVLTPVAGEENTYDVTRAEGQVIEQGTRLNVQNLNDAYKLTTSDYSGTVTYEAGTVGTRGTAVSLGTATKPGKTLIALILVSATNASNYIVQPYVSGDTVYAGIYRASSAAVTGASITVRAVWAPT